MYCLYCGSAIKPDAQFCEKCGRRLQGAVTPSVQATSQAVSSKSNPALTRLVVLLVGALIVFGVFNVIPALLMTGLLSAWLFVFQQTGMTQQLKLIWTVATLAVALGIQAYQVHSEAGERKSSAQPQPVASTQLAVQEPSFSNLPKFRVFKFKTDVPTAYVVPVETTDEQIKTLLWYFRKNVRAGDFKKIGLTQPTALQWGQRGYKSGMLSVYRGAKCANEGYISDAQVESGNLGLCGYGDHDDAYYQWGIPNPTKDRNGFFDEGMIRKDGQETLVFQDKEKQ